MDLFGFASQIATSGYVAAKIASCELSISGCQMAVAVELSIIVACIAAALIAKRLCKNKDDQEVVILAAVVVAIVAAFFLIVSSAVIVSSYQELAAWGSDPVAKVVKSLEDAL